MRKRGRLTYGGVRGRGSSSDVDGEIFPDLIYGPIVFRLLAGHGVLNDEQAEAIVTAVFSGIKA